MDGDAVVIFNFRADRVIEFSKAPHRLLTRPCIRAHPTHFACAQAMEGGPEFDKFDRVRVPTVKFAGLMQARPHTRSAPSAHNGAHRGRRTTALRSTMAT